MAPPKVLAAAVNAFNDDLSVIDPPTFARVVVKRQNHDVDVAIHDDGMKRHKSMSSRRVVEHKAADATGGKEKNSSLRAKDKVV